MLRKIAARPRAAVLLLYLVGATTSVQAYGAVRSATHALPAKAKPDAGAVRTVYFQAPPAPFGLAIHGDKWDVYSRGVNRINSFSVSGTSTWLATDMGVKVIDRAHAQVTHYTKLDGLPDDKVAAVAADNDKAWAVVPTKRGDTPMAALCEFRRTANRWAVLRETSRPVVALPSSNGMANQGYSPGAAVETALVAACPEKVCFALGPIRREDKFLALCYDRRLNLWDEIPIAPAYMADRTSLSILWLDVDRDGIWLATTAGLLRYRLREKQWQRYLPDSMVYAAAKADDGSLWLATYQGVARLAAGPVSAADTNLSPGHWSATHFVPKSTQVRHYIVPDGAGRISAYGPRTAVLFSGISIAEKSIWLTPGARVPYGPPPPFERLYPQEETWRAYSPQNQIDFDAVPDTAIEQPTLPRTSLILGNFPWRLTDWMCRDCNSTPADTTSRGSASSRESDGTVWSTDGRSLLQTEERGGALRRYGLGPLSIAVTPQISAVTVQNNGVFALSNGDLQCYDLAAGAWRRVRLPRSNWSSPSDERLIPDGDRLWVGTPSLALLYDPRSGQFTTESSSQNGGYRLLGKGGGAVWLRGPDNLLYRSDAKTGEPEAVELNALPPALASQYERPLSFGMAGRIVWMRFQDKKDAQKCLYIGYDAETGVWTREHAAAKPYPSPPTCLAVGRLTFLPIVEDDALVRCYDAQTGQWSVVAPKEPMGHGESALTLVSADDDEIWGVDSGTRTLMCYHRKQSSWSLHQLPQTFWVQPTGNEAVKFGNTIYLATNLGVWTFDTTTHVWGQLPGFATRDIYLNGVVVEPGAVWSIARPANGNQAFAVRMDKVGNRWQAWGEAEGFPEKNYPDKIIPDGKTAWVIAAGECFHLDSGTNRWYSASTLLAREMQAGSVSAPPAVSAPGGSLAKLQVSAVEPDGDSVWILPSELAPAVTAAKKRSLLVRFDKTTGKYEQLDPGADSKLVGRALQVDQQSAWVITLSCVYRYGKSDHQWRTVQPPPPATAQLKVEPQSVLQRGSEFWFFGADGAVRWDD